MENNQQQPINTASNQAPKENGKWEVVDASTLGFPLNGEPNKPITGPDGSIYCISNGQPSLSSLFANQNNAIPTPSSIIQMPPIVQPIALVPFASQNQPMLQYDPYSRPADTKVEQPEAPRYKKKAYRGISIFMMVFSVISLVGLIFLSNITGKFNSNGLDMFFSLLALCGVGVTSNYYTAKIEPFISDISAAFKSDAMSTIVTLALPIFITIMVILLLVMFIRYAVKFDKSKSPRGFSLCAFLNICLSISSIAIIFGMARGMDAKTTFITFFGMQSAITFGIGLLINLVLNIIMIFLPLFAKKNAYVMDIPDAKKVYIINQ